MSEPRYPYLHVDVSSDDAELVSAQLFELGALGVEERDASTLRKAGGVLPITLVASFADEAGALAARAELDGYATRIEHVIGDEWRDGWKKYWRPFRASERLVVVPSWEKYEPGPRDLVLQLDPGQAFGTGTHETTQLLLQELEARVRPGVRVLDVGTGSGILAIAALMFGAESATAIDNDPLAVDAARENAARNGVEAKLHASGAPLESIAEQYPLVLANIEARVLQPCAPVLMPRVAPGGLLLLSGLLASDVSNVRAAYRDFDELARPERGEWRALVLRAPEREA